MTMSKYAMVVNYKYCTACHSCEVACRQELEIPVEEWGIKLAEMGPKKMAGAWEWNYVPIRSHLCDYCASRLEKGEQASCEFHCLAQCIQVVPVENLPEVLAGQDGETAVFTS